MTKRKPVDPSKDLTGQRFGKLTVVEYVGNAKDHHSLWRCKCDCGGECVVQGNNLKSGSTKTCGCYNWTKSDDKVLGHKFGRLTPIRKLRSIKWNEIEWECLCDCGNKTRVRATDLIRGRTKSCGCLSRDITTMRSTIHGSSKRGHVDRLYRIYHDMKRRCQKEYRQDYGRYGRRGINVCQEWKNSYETFRDWALSHGYSMELTIDRIDVNGDYCPENCRWATQIEQQNNKRSNHIIEVRGEKMTLAEASRKYGIKYGTLASRIYRGASDEEAIFGKAGV